MAKVHSTNDVPLELLESFAADLRPDVLIEVDSSQIFLKSAEPPSLIVLFGSADWWVQLLGVYGGLYVAEIVKEAAKDSWKNRGQAADALKLIGGGVKRLAKSIHGLRGRLSSKTTIKPGLPMPNAYFGTTLDLARSDVEHVEQAIVAFVAHLPKIVEVIDAQRLTGRRVLAGMQLKLLKDSALEISWSEYSETDGFAQRREVLQL